MSTTAYINGSDVLTLGVKYLSRDISNATITTYSDWLRQSLNPLYYGTKETFKVITARFRVKRANRADCETVISNLTKALEKCTLKFSNSPYYYDCILTEKPEAKRYSDQVYEISATLNSGYAYLPDVSVTMSVTSQVINVAGNMPTPAVVTLTAGVALVSAKLTGFGKDITVSNLASGTPVIIDGEKGLVTQGGANKFGDTVMWGFPVLQPGNNAISIDSSNVTVQITYKPKYL